MSDEDERAVRRRGRYRMGGRNVGRHRDPIEPSDPVEPTANGRTGTNAGRRDEESAIRSVDGSGYEVDRDDSECRCNVTFHGDQLIVDAEDCPGSGRLADSPGCRETVVDVLSVRDATAVCVRVGDTERACASDATGLLFAAGRFAELCTTHDPALATRVRRDPLAGARLAAARSDYTARIAAETGLLEGATRFGSYREAFGDRDAYRVRNFPYDFDGRDSRRSGDGDHGRDRAEHTAHRLDDGESSPWYRRRHDDSPHPTR